MIDVTKDWMLDITSHHSSRLTYRGIDAYTALDIRLAWPPVWDLRILSLVRTCLRSNTRNSHRLFSAVESGGFPLCITPGSIGRSVEPEYRLSGVWVFPNSDPTHSIRTVLPCNRCLGPRETAARGSAATCSAPDTGRTDSNLKGMPIGPSSVTSRSILIPSVSRRHPPIKVRPTDRDG